MKITAILSILLLAATAVDAGCYSGGENWGNKRAALNAAHKACNNRLKGTYGSEGVRRVCLNREGKKFQFRIHHLKSGSRTLRPAECFDGLQKEINGCSHGGDTSYTNWRYIADPNAGRC